MSWRRRMAFTGVLLVLIAGLLEVGAAIVFRVVTRERFSYDDVEQAQQSLTGALAASVTQPGSGKAEHKMQELARLYRTPHPYLGFVYSQDLNRVRNPQIERRFPINAFGFIDENPPIRKRSKGEVLIGIIGGSVAVLFYRGGEQSLIKELEAYPQFRDKKISFVRLALGGLKQPQQLMTLTYLLSLGAEFDYLVNIDGFNEVTLPPQENLPSGIYPYFPRSWDIIASPIPDPEFQRMAGKDAWLRERRVDWARAFLDWSTRYSVTLQLIWAIRDRNLAVEIVANQQALRAYKPNKRSFMVTGPGVDGFTVENMPGKLAEHWRNCSKQMHRLCEDHDIRYLHFLQPNQYVKGSKPMGSSERQRAFNEAHPFKRWAELGYPELIRKGRELRQAGVDFHDLTMVFAKIEEQLYVDDCCHFNERGNEIMAQQIAQAILNASNRDTSDGLFGMDPNQTGPIISYGRGVSGAGGEIPILDTAGQAPAVGNADFQLRVKNAIGGADGSLLIADRPEHRNAVRRGLCVPLEATAISLRTSGHAGMARSGVATVRLPIPNNPALRGMTIYCQAVVRDSGADGGWSRSNGLRIRFK